MVTKAAAIAGPAGAPAHEQVYQSLRDMVLFGALAPGDPVTIQGLVARMQVGMTPVREALRRLTAEGALESLGNRRIVVPVLDSETVAELTLARLALEPLLAERAAERAAPSGVAELQAIDARLDRAIAQGDIEDYLRENHAFHAGIHAMAAAPVLSAMTDGVWLRFGPSLRVVCGQLGTAQLPDLHKDVLAALAAGDGAAARAAIVGDVSQGMALIAQGISATT